MPNNRFRRRVVIAVASLVAVPIVTASPLASAGPASTNALQLIMLLQRQGDQVIVHRAGDKPLQMCTVISVREGRSEYWWTHPRMVDPSPARRANGRGSQLLYRTVYIDVRC
ncbi:hypothetical protein BST43_04855 [Mycobacteroides saopaulense]|uniref:Ig-like domain-containing protein n=1 Tax=Mycobacteroides saopaulense TaxID=1578165 RepID=A0A1S4W0K9_9MYCO|nr:hypothetical protein [Mycobacteroides saopaulense]ALR11576.1 hypothetical protein MYCSP_09000 [Mycobacteroides saopaulense]ORB60016.1 hypothetical protein BST43_04855 [Mycobacteroides saopaulense]